MEEFVSEDAIGDEGYLVDAGLVPLADAKRQEVRNTALNLKPMTK